MPSNDPTTRSKSASARQGQAATLFFRPGPGWLDIEGRQFGKRRAALSAEERHAAALTQDGAATSSAAPPIPAPKPVAVATPSTPPAAAAPSTSATPPVSEAPVPPPAAAAPRLQDSSPQPASAEKTGRLDLPPVQNVRDSAASAPVPGAAKPSTTAAPGTGPAAKELPTPSKMPSAEIPPARVQPAKTADAPASPAPVSPKDIAVAQTDPPADVGMAADRADNAKVQSIPNPARETVVAERPVPAPSQTPSQGPGQAPSPTPRPVAAEDRPGGVAPPESAAGTGRSPAATAARSSALIDTAGSAPRPTPSTPPQSTVATPPVSDPPTEPATLPPTADGRPPALAAARDGRPDDLKLIKGIGPKNETACNALGIFHIDQIATWSPAHAAWVGKHLTFPGRIERESWVDQARALALGFDTSHAAAVKAGAIVNDAALSDAEVAALRADIPAFAPSVDDESRHAGHRPVGLAAARGGAPDDLQRIRGIGKQNEARLQALGIWHFVQISKWTPDNVQWVGSYLAFPGRITREDWITQAGALAAGAAPAPVKAVPKPAPANPTVAEPAVAKPAAARRRRP